MTDRAQVQLVDAVVGLLVLVSIMALAPLMYNFTDMVVAEADPFSSLLLRLVLPLLIIGFVVSIGVSARRGGS